MTNPPLFAQAPPPPNSDGELVFYRDDSNFNDDVWITVSLVDLVFNEQGIYNTNVYHQHPDKNVYPAGSSLAGNGWNYPIRMPKPGFFPERVVWESAAPDDARPGFFDWGTSIEYCHGMIGWGNYKVHLYSERYGEIVFFVNTKDGNWLHPTSGNEHTIAIRIRQPVLDRPECEVYNWNTSSYVAISPSGTVNSWDIHSLTRERTVQERAWDYSEDLIAPAPFTIMGNEYYPLQPDPPNGDIISAAKLDVNARLINQDMIISANRKFSIADWTDDQHQTYTTTLVVLDDVAIKVEGELLLDGRQIGENIYTVTLRGSNPQRGFWTGIKTGPNANVLVFGAHILHTVHGVDLIEHAFLYANQMEIAEFEEYGVRQIDANAVVMNARIHSGSIGVHATGDCRDSFYGGWLEEEGAQPVEVYNCSGHGFELVDLLPYIIPDGGNFLYHLRSFCVQFSKIHSNRLYGIWIRGSTGSPLIHQNKIYNNGMHAWLPPTHDGVHVNAAGIPSIHQNMISGNAYGIHTNDGAFVVGSVSTHHGPWSIDPDPTQHHWLGYNCIVGNTINLGNNRNASIHFGGNQFHEHENDGTPKRIGGSNRFGDPVSGRQVSNGTGYVFAGHNCWYPTYNVTGTVETYNDFANCATHDLPDCSIPRSLTQGSILFSAPAGTASSMNSLHHYFARNDWIALKNEGLSILHNSHSQQDIAQAALLLAKLVEITNDQSIEGYLSNFWTNVQSGNMPLQTKHAVLTSILIIKMGLGNSIDALQICTLIEQHCAGSDLAKTGMLFRGMILGGIPGYRNTAINVVSDMLARTPGDTEASALYYSLTHRDPPVAPKQNSAVLREDIILYRNYPNPFNPVTEIRFSVPTAMHVRLIVRDIHGHIVATLINGEVQAEVTSVTFDASALESGLYIYALETVHGSVSQRMLLVK